MKNLGFVFLALLMTISSPFVAMGLPDDRELRENDLGAAEEAQRLNNEGALLAKQGSFLEAIQSFQGAIRLMPDFAPAYYNLGLAQRNLNDFGKARAAFQSAVEFAPDYGEAWYQLGRVYELEERFEEAARHFEKALEVSLEGPDVRYHLGIVSLRLKNWADVVEHWEVLLQAYPEHPGVPDIQEALPRAFYNLGTTRQQTGQLEAAVAAFEKAIWLRPDYVKAHYNLGYAYRDMNQLPEARAALNAALDHGPDSPKILSALGIVFMRQDSLWRAEELFRSALSVDQDFIEANYNLTEVYLRQGQVERALDEIRGIVKRTPNNPKAHAFLAYVYEHGVEGKRYGKDYRAADAIRTYEFALLLTPNASLLHYNLGVIHGRLGDWDQALQAFRRCLAIDSTHAEAKHWLPLVEARLVLEQDVEP